MASANCTLPGDGRVCQSSAPRNLHFQVCYQISFTLKEFFLPIPTYLLLILVLAAISLSDYRQYISVILL